MNIELIMAEFRDVRRNAGGAKFDCDRLNPTLDSFRKYFPNCKVTLYCDFDYKNDDVNIIKVDPSKLFDQTNSRWPWMAANYYKAFGICESECDVAMAMDSDHIVVSDDVKSIIDLVDRFDVCVPSNPRGIMKVDGILGINSNYNPKEEGSMGNGFAVNTSPLVGNPKAERTQKLFRAFCDTIVESQPFGRATLALSRTIWKTGIVPYLLPYQWCVCQESIGCGNEIILHVGHPEVNKVYVEQWGFGQ